MGIDAVQMSSSRSIKRQTKSQRFRQSIDFQGINAQSVRGDNRHENDRFNSCDNGLKVFDLIEELDVETQHTNQVDNIHKCDFNRDRFRENE